MTRQLASIQRIISVDPIPGADNIEVVGVLGWMVVVKKNEFKVGDLCVYFEIDSWLSADDPRYASFEDRFSNWGTKRGMRLRTIRLRKQLSQGLALSVSTFDEVKRNVEGDDVTDVLKIEKWESLEEQNSNSGGTNIINTRVFPSFIRKTDQERVQNCMTQLAKLSHDETFEESIKIDGSSMTVFHLNNSSPYFKSEVEKIEYRMMKHWSNPRRWLFKLCKMLGLTTTKPYLEGVCSRNIQLDNNGDNHFSKYVEDHNIFERLSNMGRNIAIQGELLAPSIQKNYEKVSGFEFHIYDVFDIDTQEYLKPVDARQVVLDLGLSYVVVLRENVSLKDFSQSDIAMKPKKLVDAILLYAEGPGMNPGVKREGLVYKSNQTGFSFKCVSNSYLLAKEKKSE